MIEVHQLTKMYDSFTAVDNVSFKVHKGEILGFLGPNGAGKSTTMKMLTCFVNPTSGHATICGHSILESPIQVRMVIGYVPENAPLYFDMTVVEFLKYIGELRGLEGKDLDAKIETVIETCWLKDVFYRPIETLSKGFKRRVSLAQAFLPNPQVLILDEPTDGLDPNQKFEIRSIIKSMAKEKCIVLSTHILEEVEAVCNRAIIISEGKIKYDGTPEDLKRKSSKQRIDEVFRAITTNTQIQGVSL